MVSFSEPQPSSCTVPSHNDVVHAPSKSHDAENGANRIDDTMADDTVASYEHPDEVVQNLHPHRILKIPRHRRRQRSWLLLFWLILGWVMVVILAARLWRHRHSEPPSNTDDDSDFVVRINSGSAAPYFDQKDREWSAEAVDLSVAHTAPFVVTDHRNEVLYTVNGDGYLFDSAHFTPNSARKPIPNAGVEGVGLYRDERYFRTNGIYTIPVPKRKAWYRVDLYFCEVYFGAAGQRLFDVYVNNDLIRENFDIVEAAGGYNFTAVVVSHSVYVRNQHSITVELESIVEHAKISGIQVQSL
jgi:Malectin domain